jgi:N-acetylmuramoyl-L-alanine amidase
MTRRRPFGLSPPPVLWAWRLLGLTLALATLFVVAMAAAGPAEAHQASAGNGKVLGVASTLPPDFAFPSLASGSSGPEVMWLERRLAELSYRPGPIDEKFDRSTRQAVIAFQKWEGLPRDGIVGKAVWQALESAVRPMPTRNQAGTWIEVNKAKQVLLFCRDGVVERTLPCSTGNPGIDGGMFTPSGTHMVYRENTWETHRYKPLYLRPWGVWAIHGYPSVPVYPASHGCIRIPIWDMDELHALVPVGTDVYVY